MVTLTFSPSLGATLELVTGPATSAELPHWDATLTAPGARLAVPCAESPYGNALFEYLEGLDQNWRGWVGERVWTSREGGVRFIATHDGVAFVVLTVILEDAGHLWRHEAELRFDAGAFGPLARAARTAHLPSGADGPKPEL